MTRTRWTRGDLANGEEIVRLVDLTFGGKVLRLASMELDVGSAAGDLHYSAGLLAEPLHRRSLSLFSLTPELARMPLELEVPVDVPALQARGHVLAHAPISVSEIRVRDGVVLDDYEHRVVLLTGRCAEVRTGERGYDEDDAPFTELFVTVERASWSAPGRIPLDSEAVSPETWTVGETKLTGADYVAYPYLFGYPGLDPLDPQGWIPAGMVAWARKETLYHVAIVAFGSIGATSAVFTTDTDGYGEVVTLTETYTGDGTAGIIPSRDLLGQLLTVVDYNSLGYETGGLDASYAPALADTSPVYFSIPTGGGMLKPGGEVLRGAGDVLQFMLARAGVRVDYGRLSAAVPYLNSFLIDAIVDEQINVLDWCVGELLPLLPVTLAESEDGIFPVVWRHDASLADAVLHIDADLDRLIEVSDTVSERTSVDLYNRFTLQYGWSPRSRKYVRTMRVGPDAVESTWHAEHVLSSAGGASRLKIKAAVAGQAGAGIVVTLTDTGVEDITEDPIRKTVDIEFDGATTTTASLHAKITSGALLTATYTQADAANPWTATDTPTVTTLIADFGTRAHPLCRSSRDLLRRLDGSGPEAGIRRKDENTLLVNDHQTARRTLEWKAAAFSMPDRRVEVSGPVAAFAGLDEGSFVSLTYTPHAISRQLGVVEIIESDGFRIYMQLVFKAANRTSAAA